MAQFINADLRLIQNRARRIRFDKHQIPLHIFEIRVVRSSCGVSVCLAPLVVLVNCEVGRNVLHRAINVQEWISERNMRSLIGITLWVNPRHIKAVIMLTS